ncbi:hypothetical protein OQI_29475 [Streptomyces pharetrae CZA14]|uniref:Uncharacterized protein n=1 Tax=Streptomyces pharetrae CZA14 TaxID=1144883 RepID=A0ABX3YC84_9ACTN|nr:hypothetical protein OQI_29475 [Streptomyces pharetrae CZA14]
MGQKQQTGRFEALDEEDQRRARIRLAHLLETETGYRSGSPFWAEEGEPRPQFDPAHAPLTQRRKAKVAELAALPSEDAKFLGLGQVGERTLRRLRPGPRQLPAQGCGDEQGSRGRRKWPCVAGTASIEGNCPAELNSILPTLADGDYLVVVRLYDGLQRPRCGQWWQQGHRLRKHFGKGEYSEY